MAAAHTPRRSHTKVTVVAPAQWIQLDAHPSPHTYRPPPLPLSHSSAQHILVPQGAPGHPTGALQENLRALPGTGRGPSPRGPLSPSCTWGEGGGEVCPENRGCKSQKELSEAESITLILLMNKLRLRLGTVLFKYLREAEP